MLDTHKGIGDVNGYCPVLLSTDYALLKAKFVTQISSIRVHIPQFVDVQPRCKIRFFAGA